MSWPAAGDRGRVNPIRRSIAAQITALLGAPRPAGTAAGDGGLFGPHSAVRTVHGDLPAMLIGGLSSLLLQMLHPSALAGIWDHSNFRQDMPGRLRRTAGFIAITTRGSTEAANDAIARVRAIHERVTGLLPDGTPYAATDPALLTWVHVAEARSFLAAYLRYRDPSFTGDRQDAYYADMAMLARRLGAADVPVNRRDVGDYLQTMRASLRRDARTIDVRKALMRQPGGSAVAIPVQTILFDAGMDLLPGWARALHGVPMPLGRRLAARAGGTGAGHVLRWALR